MGAAKAAAAPPGRRFAIVVGANHGDADDGPLQYAESDAQRMLNLLIEVGDVSPDNGVALLGTGARGLRRTLDELSGRMIREAWGPRDLLFLYVSSHAAEGDLHLAGSRFSIRELKDFLAQVPVGVAILVLDTCDAGAAIREKGLRPLSNAVVTVETPDVTGRVIIASSGAHEAALESDALHASYFTHNLAAGLRGAADTSHDGEVTLQEAFTYAYARTVEETTGAATGQQTPEYDVKLQGRGDLVLTEPLRAHGRLLLDIDQPGEFLLVSQNGSSTVEHFVKAVGPARFAIEPGQYRLWMRGDNGGRACIVTIPELGEARISLADFTRAESPEGRRKGTGTKDWYVGIGGGVGTGAVPGLGALGRGDITLRWEPGGRFLGGRPLLAVDVAYQQESVAVEPTFAEREVQGTLGAGLAWTVWSRFQIRALLKGGFWYVRQTGVVGGSDGGTQALGAVEAGLTASILGPLAVDVSVTPGLGAVERTTGWGPMPFIGGTAGVGAMF